MKPISEALTELDAKIAALIRESLGESTVSYSSFNEIATGNAYEAVLLRDAVTDGFRTRDPQLFAGIPMRGKRFVDLGCNLGEKTRLAALAGAAYAEGIEYEEFFVRVGGLISVYNRSVNVFLKQGDITEQDCLTSDFDIAACFSAFVYAERNLPEILARVRELFVLETHALDQNWYKAYVSRVEPLMPYWIVLGFSDHGAGLNTTARALIVFGRERERVELVGINRSDELSLDHPDVRYIDLAESSRVKRIWGEGGGPRALFAEMRSKFSSGSCDLSDVLRPGVEALGDMVRTLNRSTTHFGSDRYWYEFLRGLVGFLVEESLQPGNPYVVFLRRLSAEGKYDRGMEYELSDETRALARLAPRFARFAQILRDRAVDRPLLMYNPLDLASLESRDYRPGTTEVDEHVTYVDGSVCRTQFIDGNHRLAALWLSGAETCPVLPVWTNVFGLTSDKYRLFEDASYQDAHAREIISESVLASHPGQTERTSKLAWFER